METITCKYCTSLNFAAASHCRRCNRWLGANQDATDSKWSMARVPILGLVAACIMVAAAAYAVPFMLSAFDHQKPPSPPAAPVAEATPYASREPEVARPLARRTVERINASKSNSDAGSEELSPKRSVTQAARNSNRPQGRNERVARKSERDPYFKAPYSR